MRWKKPPPLTSLGEPPNAAPNSADEPVIPIAYPAQYAAQRYSRLRAAEPAQVRAAAGMPAKIGIAPRLCSFPARVGALGGDPPSGACSDGGKPATGSVTNTPEPINPTPAARIIAGTTGGPTVFLGLPSRPCAARQKSAPTTMKFARCAQPSRPSASELTAWRRQSYPARLAPIALNAPTNRGPATTPQAVFAKTAGALPSVTPRQETMHAG